MNATRHAAEATTADAHTLFEDAIVVDGLDVSRWGEEGTYRQLRDGGVTAVNATLGWLTDELPEVVGHVASWASWFERFSDLIRPVLTAEHVRTAKAESRTGVILGLQNGLPIGDDPNRVRTLHELGIRIVQLTYNDGNLLGDGCYVAADRGLSRLGRSVVEVMNDFGVLVDLSHCGDRTTRDAIDTSSVPVAVTHANARSHIDHPRNKTDEVIRALAERGGVIGANAFPAFYPRGYDATIYDYVDAIERLVLVAGIDHVGIGTDFCHGHSREWFSAVLGATGDATAAAEMLGRTPDPHRQLVGFENPLQFRSLADRLLARGFGFADARKVLGENWLRLFEEVWR